MSIKEHPPQLHVPVLLTACLDTLRPIQGESYLDLTAGYGGHARAFLARTANLSDSVLVDRDENAIAYLGEFGEQGVRIMHTDFVSAARCLSEEGRRFSIILVDLGVSSPQLDRQERGFSFQSSGPLDMRMDPSQTCTAADIVNKSSIGELVRILTEYGEESRGFAERIAAKIVANRPLYTTGELAELVMSAHVGAYQKTHPATRTFQALRIAVNDELGQIDQLLPLLPGLLTSGGRLGIISFHSLEDRRVKQFLAEQAASGYEAELSVLTKKPICGDDYDVHNPRSRSAKLRVAVKK